MGAVTIVDVCNAFLTQAEARQDAGEITHRSWQDSLDICRLLTAELERSIAAETLRPPDLARFRTSVASRYAPSRLSKTIPVTRMVFKWAYESNVIDRTPTFGPDFRGASKRAVREQKTRLGDKISDLVG